ncbi:hypothetical protein [Marinobacterium arenosum]|uniref:hypothetical protein n=1 Tax=Marinobacterium arenosum TaxID=2862496 RepID=UPI001C966235|nr:hypothetical protein [Marinobacterium arenosum]MBY4675764.1 hypothetical protein [Marinobacterium arenosum]
MAKTSQTRLSDYLEKVAAGKPVNYSAFEKQLELAGITSRQRRELFRVELAGPNRHTVEILDQVALKELQSRFSKQALNDRVSAAAAGNSHRVSVSGACLLLRRESIPHPQVILFEGREWQCPVKPAERTLLVENLENFLALERTLAILPDCGWALSEPVDLLYAAGNQITNAILQPFLARYAELNCLFDPDLGGIHMFRTLRQRMPQLPMRFLYPQDIEARLAASNRLLSVHARTDLTNYTGVSPEVDRLIALLRQTNRTLEQETYL